MDACPPYKKKGIDLLEVYSALRHEDRIRLLNAIDQNPLCVSHLQAVLNIKQVDVSRNLAILKQAGMIHCKSHQNKCVYFIPAKLPDIIRVQIDAFRACAKSDKKLLSEKKAAKKIFSENSWLSELFPR